MINKTLFLVRVLMEKAKTKIRREERVMHFNISTRFDLWAATNMLPIVFTYEENKAIVIM